MRYDLLHRGGQFVAVAFGGQSLVGARRFVVGQEHAQGQAAQRQVGILQRPLRQPDRRTAGFGRPGVTGRHLVDVPANSLPGQAHGQCRLDPPAAPRQRQRVAGGNDLLLQGGELRPLLLVERPVVLGLELRICQDLQGLADFGDQGQGLVIGLCADVGHQLREDLAGPAANGPDIDSVARQAEQRVVVDRSGLFGQPQKLCIPVRRHGKSPPMRIRRQPLPFSVSPQNPRFKKNGALLRRESGSDLTLSAATLECQQCR
ncbi:MAG: hypothetical protein GWP05_04595 [Anaerolineaceae bacterium]|nr:hypothetical protein [Anaerolineaceae bacterium]